MTDVQRFRQSGYDNSLQPSTNADAHYMYYKDHAVVVSLLREQITRAEEQQTRLMNVIDRLIEEMRNG